MPTALALDEFERIVDPDTMGLGAITNNGAQDAAMTTRNSWPATVFGAILLLASAPALAEQIGCVTTAWKLIGSNHKVCVEAFKDPKVPGVTCHVSQARTGGVAGTFGLAQDPSEFSLACRQTGPIVLPAQLSRDETVFSEDTSILFKETRVVRLWDEKNRVLVYLGISRKLIEGAPANSISTVPVMPWGGR